MPSFLILRGVMAALPLGLRQDYLVSLPAEFSSLSYPGCSAVTAYPITPQMPFEGDR